uniref:Uncharacterized protein n=1 Tax=Magallana gigas TaxID=29159 RepID=A0A8W8MHM2_MAGGI
MFRTEKFVGGIVYSKLQEVNLDEIQNNRCIIYFVDFSEPYLVLQKVHEMSKKDYDFIFFPSNIPTFTQDFARYFTSKTIITEQTSHCWPSVNNPEATALDVISDGRRIVKESRRQFQLLKVASMSIAIFKELRWRLSVIFFDNLYALLVDVFTERINQDYFVQKLYNVDDISDEYNLLMLLKGLYLELAEHHINFTIFCSPNNTRRILKQASAFDQSKGNFRFTALRDHSSWFVVTTSPDFDDDIGTNNSILDNVILLNLIEKEFEPVVNVKNCTTSNANIFFLYTLMWKTKLDCSPQCNLYRKFEPIGCIDSNGLLKYSSFFPNSNFGFNRRHLFVTTIWWPPFTERFIKNGTTVKYFGYCMDLLRELAKALNFTYTVIEVPDGEFGALLQNGSWSGMVGQLERREVDLMVATTSVRPDREMVMDFTIPFYYDTSTLLMKKPDPNEKKLFILAKPLRWEVMVCTAVVLVVSAFFLCITEQLSPYYKVHGTQGQQDFQHSFWYMFGALLTQGGESVPKSPSGRTFVSAFWLISIVLVGTYSGNLIAFLTVPLDKPPFNSLDEMIAQSEYKWGTIGASFYVTWFNSSTVDTLQAVWAGIKKFNVTDPEVLSPDPNVHIDKMYRENYVFFGDKVFMDIRKSNQCDLMTAEEEIPNNYYAVGLPNNSLYTKTFSDQIISLQEGGILHTFQEKHWPKSIFCFAPSGLQSKSISLIDIQAAFYLTGVGIVAGLLVLIIEFGFYYFANKCCNKLNRDKCIHLQTVATNPEMSDVYHVHDNGGEVMLESPSNRRSRENKSMKLKTSHINEI